MHADISPRISSSAEIARVRPAAKSPFVKRALEQTFFTDFAQPGRFGAVSRRGGRCASLRSQAAFPEERRRLRPSSNKVSLTSSFVPIEDVSTAYPGFWNVDLKSPELEAMFHYRPAGAPTLSEYIDMRRQQLEANTR